MEKLYFYYEHTYGEGGVIGHFGELMDFIDNSYDKDRHTIQDSWEGHKETCDENDNIIEEPSEQDIKEKLVSFIQQRPNGVNFKYLRSINADKEEN